MTKLCFILGSFALIFFCSAQPTPVDLKNTQLDVADDADLKTADSFGLGFYSAPRLYYGRGYYGGGGWGYGGGSWGYGGGYGYGRYYRRPIYPVWG